ncbi:hypothetical protein QAD02_008308 [Eretmocerus hayati]|uniref:Uncharacterized protein n=1 Tax=Eretmocerus hayati TaxID=131215 RepID=A0ACC2N6Y5_9HYME|nr:hypothetical protein QAD02_008308 [Eretmocerus hayati]
MHKVAMRLLKGGKDPDKPIDGVKRPSMLLTLLKFNIILGMVPDYMHAINLGIAKYFSNMWIDHRGKPYSLPPYAVDTIDQLMSKIKVPNQLYRLSRSFKYRKWWTAREWKNWILYYSIPVLSAASEFKDYLSHWTLLVPALYLLLQEEGTRSEVQQADALLREFVMNTEKLYGKSAMTYNVHQLLHSAQSVINWGPLWAHSGYLFENGIGILVKSIHSPRGVIHQLTRTINFAESFRIMKKEIVSAGSNVVDFVSSLERQTAKFTTKLFRIRYFGYPKEPSTDWVKKLNLSRNCSSYKKIVKDRCLYDTDHKDRARSNNAFAVTKSGEYVRLLDFIVDESVYKEYCICNSLVLSDIGLNDALKMRMIKEISHTDISIVTESIDRVCVVVDIGHDRYICPVPHPYTY